MYNAIRELFDWPQIYFTEQWFKTYSQCYKKKKKTISSLTNNKYEDLKMMYEAHKTLISTSSSISSLSREGTETCVDPQKGFLEFF